MRKLQKRAVSALIAAGLLLGLTGCGENEAKVVEQGAVGQREALVVFSATSRTDPNDGDAATTALDRAIMAFETEHTDVRVAYKTYNAKDYQEKSYDEVVLDRVRHHMGDDLYMMNPDTAYTLNQEGYLVDLSDMDAADSLTDAARQQCTVDGKLISLPLTMICYGLFTNQDMLDRYGLEPPQTTGDFLHCCEVLKANGITPIAANRWWMETFVLTQGFAPLYLEDGVEEKIAALNSGETPISQYMRPGFEFLAELMDKEYFDVDFASTAEAEDEMGMFLNQEVAFVVHYDRAVEESVYGSADFHLAVLGFPTDEYGQVNLMNAAQRMCINRETKHLEAAKALLEALSSKEAISDMLVEGGGFPPRMDVENQRPEVLRTIYENVDAGRAIPGSNPEIHLEQWGTTCEMVQKLFSGVSVDEIMKEFDALQME